MKKFDPYKKPTIDELLKSIVKNDWKFTNEAIKNYSLKLIDFVIKNLFKDTTKRLWNKSGMVKLFYHAVFKKELISLNKVDVKPDTYIVKKNNFELLNM